MFHRRSLSILLAGVIVALASAATAAVPGTLGLEGALRSAAGPVADGTYKMTFRIYAKAVGGQALWQEGPLDVLVASGRFAHALGSSKALSAKLIETAEPGWLGVQIASDPELPLRPLHAVAWALRAGVAEAVACSGCIDGAQLADATIAAAKVGFTYAGSATKGGPATSANVAADLNCTGCVSVSELVFDGDLNLGGNGLSAKKISATDVAATTVQAASFIGDGAKLTGLKFPAGACKNKGEVVKGIDVNGGLVCVPAVGVDALPADGLNEVSNGQLSTEFLHEISSAKAVVIPDNNPIGVSSDIVVPDLGTAMSVSISVDLSNPAIADLTLYLFDPSNKQYVLHKTSGNGSIIKTSWPSPTALVEGDLTAMNGKNPKGIWRLKAVDGKAANAPKDGEIKSWSVTVQILSSGKVEAKGLLLTSGGLQLLSATKAPVVCDAARFGYMYANPETKSIFVCNGDDFYPISLITLGTQKVPAASCKDMLTKVPLTKTGLYWIDPDGLGGDQPYRVYCDMDTDGGGWTLVWSNLRGGSPKFETGMKWDTAINTMPLIKGDFGEDPEKFQVYTGLKHWIAIGGELRYSWAHDYGKPIDQSYRCNYKLEPANSYRITFSGCKQLVGSVVPGLVSAHGGHKFSTTDKDNDVHGGSCSNGYSGTPWWYTACWNGNINGGGVTLAGHRNAAYWYSSSNSDGAPGGSGGGNGWIFIR